MTLRSLLLAVALLFAPGPIAFAAEACDGPEEIKAAIMEKKGASFLQDVTDPDEVAALAAMLEQEFLGARPGDSYMVFGRDGYGLVFVSITDGCPDQVYTAPLPGATFPELRGV